MGYYTRFTVQQPTFWTDQMKQDLVDINPGYFPDKEEVNDFLDDYYYEEMKWYDHEKDMIKLSLRHPETLFALHGVDEENKEWIGYYKNGKSFISRGTVVFEEFDESKLK